MFVLNHLLVPVSLIPTINADGVAVHLSHTKYYCGRNVGQAGYAHASGHSDGRCGPTNGDQCHACFVLNRPLIPVPSIPVASAAMVDDGECWPTNRFVDPLEDGHELLCFCSGVLRDAVGLPCGCVFGKV